MAHRLNGETGTLLVVDDDEAVRKLELGSSANSVTSCWKPKALWRRCGWLPLRQPFISW